jgi:hypothetical protein
VSGRSGPISLLRAALLGFCLAVGLFLLPPACLAQDQAIDRELDVSVFIWDTTAEGIGAVRAMQLARPRYDVGPIVVASSSPRVTAMTANGLSVEDRQGTLAPDGFWHEVRRGITSHYAERGQKGMFYGRMVVEPDVASAALRWYLDYNRPEGRPGTTFVHAHLLEADPEERFVLLRTAKGEVVRVRAQVFIDASVEGDLARKMGAHYRFGVSETLFGPGYGVPPRPDADVPDTLIQRLSALLTLDVTGGAGRMARFRHPFYDHLSYHSGVWQSESNRRAFANSWSMRHPLPNGKRELNEGWSDYPDVTSVWRYVFGYDSDHLVRRQIRDRAITYVAHKVRYLNENGYPHVGVAQVPQRVYIREGIRALGLDTLTASDVTRGTVRQPVAVSEYGLYDVHLHGFANDHTPTRVHLPMGSLISVDLSHLLIPGPVSVEHRAYNGAIRMEWGKANRGAAAGIVAAIAVARGTPPAEVPYEAVRAELHRQGYSNIP